MLIAGLINIPSIQNWIVREATYKLAKDLHTRVKIDHVDLNLVLLNKMQLNGTLVEDHNKDTLLYAGALSVRITDWFFVKDKIVLKYLSLRDATINLHRVDSVWNYTFLADYFSSPSTGPKKKSGVDLDLKTVELDRIRLLRKDEWRGEDMFFSVRSLDLDARKLSVPEKNMDITNLELVNPYFSIYNYKGRRPPRPHLPDTADVPDPVTTGLQWNPEGWKGKVGNLVIHNGTFKNSIQINRPVYKYFDGAYMVFDDIESHFKDINLFKDTVSARVQLSTHERSGFNIASLSADFKMHPRAMEFAHLDIKTGGKSHLQNFFAMRYRSFDDLSDFIDKVNMEGNLKESEVESSDLAYFAPEIKTWKKRLFLTGRVRGTVANLTANDVQIKAGANTFFSGSVKMIGLPDIEETFIDLTSKDFRTTYADAVAFVPQLSQVTEPDLRLLGYMKFRGYFTGLLNDFITSGVIQTGLGTVTTDMNLKMPARATSSYYGTLTATNFELGKLLQNSKLDRVSFNGKIDGKGFTLKDLQANLVGQVQKIGFNNYTYSNIDINGQFSKKMFNGQAAIQDSNLVAGLMGLIDLRTGTPRFDLAASISKSNLKKLQLYAEDIDISADLKFDFSGSDIDNFEGSAKVFNADIYKDGQRLSFDSLTLSATSLVKDSLSPANTVAATASLTGTSTNESEPATNPADQPLAAKNGARAGPPSLITSTRAGKRVEIRSNEFSVDLSGEFSIKELPAAFQTFLNRYFPSYINPSPRKLLNDDFTFAISTRKVDNYVGIFVKDLTGFNTTSVTGSINTKQNLFHLKTAVPKFSYKNIDFYNVALTGDGNMDSLNLASTIEDIFVNDSLHFPNTAISIRSSQDISKVNIAASASQTLNSANISGQVQTLPDGVRISFNPSVFEINAKKWTIDAGGELVLSKKLVTSDGLKIYNNEQEIRLSSTPSSIGNSNDLLVDLKNINIGDFAPFFSKDNRLEGLLNGHVEVIDPFENLHVDMKGEARQFRLDNDSIGRLQLSAMYAKGSGTLQTRVSSDNPQYNFDLEGLFNLLDSTRRQDMDLKINLQHTSIHLLERYMTGIFSRMSGEATGVLQVVGGFNNLKYLGSIELKNGGLLVDYTKCYYKIPGATIRFEDGVIDFGSFPVKDSLNNSGEIVNGKLYHQNFKSMSFDFHLRSNQMLVLNTTSADNNQFYGTMIGKVNMSFTGPMEDMQMDIKGEPTDTSNIYLPIGSSRETGAAGYIVWKVYGREMQNQGLSEQSNLTVALDLTANKYAKVFVILDELTGDIIEATGNGNIRLQVEPSGSMTMNGRFNIEKGNYTFTFQSLKRNFKLRGDAGSYIAWNGDPYNAVIDVEAEYEANNVRFSDLLNGSKDDSIMSQDVKRYRGQVLVIANITESLNAPKIAFHIELPANSPIRNDFNIASTLNRIQTNENELNKQVSFLILFNTFGPYTGEGARSASTSDIANKALEGIVVNSISGFLSNILTSEFSNVLQDVFKDKSLKVNINATLYSGSNLISNYNTNQIALPDRTNFNLSIGKSFFNERLSFIVGGALDFGLNTTQQNQSAAFPFLPDVTAEWRLTPDGKFRLTFFYRENYTYLGAGGKQNRSGSSISFRKEFDRVDELFKKKKSKP